MPKGQDRYSEIYFANAQEVADSLAVNLANTNYFDEVVICDSALAPPTVSLHDEYQLSSFDVDELCAMFNVDMLVSVELAVFIMENKLSEEYYPSGQIYSALTLYLPGKKTPLDTIVKRNWVSWNEFPTKEEMLENIVPVAASLPVSSIVPQWESVEFPYYANGCVEMRDADVCLRENDWDGALSLWKQVLNSKSRRNQMRANLNIAVWHEVHDDSITTAREYALKARDLAASKLKKNEQGVPVNPSLDYKLISRYIYAMERRGKDLSRVKTQMHRFSDDF